ncbi:hypothetical protein [Litoreibacter arenae]|uniref:Uncharacterized protein n=1 Tax=Litoreibacter arenae DSM 19593 TaxID=1123360 RepID=S9QGQ1_9RHOB|nr:hypothetical protein [Litoreibacter arenae]EPX79032.1 hypothetical protein thalar_01849 [Litoreibacter arenae DSM 19593]
MKKVWNPATRSYDFLADGLTVDGVEYDEQTAMAKWNDRQGASKCRKAVARSIIKTMVQDCENFDKHHLWLGEMENRILSLNHDLIDRVKGKGSGGKHTISFKNIPTARRPGILAIVNGNGANHDRKKQHNTTPALQVNAVQGPFKEYHLVVASEDGRATTAMCRGEMLIYYSTTHAAATYNYHLVTFPCTLDINGTSVTLEVPLSGGSRDNLLTLPTA